MKMLPAVNATSRSTAADEDAALANQAAR